MASTSCYLLALQWVPVKSHFYTRIVCDLKDSDIPHFFSSFFFSFLSFWGAGWRKSDMLEDSLQSFNDLKSVVVLSAHHTYCAPGF